jgi:hypothetical protein
MVGAGIDSARLNTMACDLAQRWAAAANEVMALAKYVDQLGQAGLELAGFTVTAEATQYQTAVDTLKTVALVWQGQATQAGLYDFSNALAAFIGPLPEA